MKRTNNTREHVAGAVSLVLGLTIAAALKVGFLSPSAAPAQAQGSTAVKPAPVRVRAKVDAVAPLLKASNSATKPVPPKARPAVREVAVQSPAALASRALPPPLVELAPTVVLEQPAHVPRTETTAPDVPLLALPATLGPSKASILSDSGVPVAPSANIGATAGQPDAPPDDYVPPPRTFVEQPGGEVLVLGLLLDSKGRALDLKILVPSYDTVSDTKYAMAVLNNQSFTDIDPPIPPGESRWIETRVYYPKQTIVPTILP